MTAPLPPETYKRISLITLIFGLLTNYYLIAIFVDTIHILIATQQELGGEHNTTEPAADFFAALLPLMPLSLLLLVVSFAAYLYYHRLAKQ